MAKSILCLALAIAITVLAAANELPQQQRVLRRVIKSTPTATNLGRVRLVTVRSAGSQPGAVSEISSKEAANFGQRSELSGQQQAAAAANGAKTKASTASPTSTTTSTTTTTTTSAPSTTSLPTSKPLVANKTPTLPSTHEQRPKASDRQQAAPQQTDAVEVLAIAPSSWQTMTSVEAPAAALIAAGPRPAVASSDLSSSPSEESLSTSDFARASSTSKTSYSSVGETFSRLRQSGKTSAPQQQQSYFYPQPQRAQGKTSQATKSIWYQPTTSTTPRPAPIIQEQQYEQYVEQQQVEGAAPLGQAEPFAFDFNTQDNSGNGQYRKEESDKNGVVRGSYGYTDANGIYRHVEYVADQDGFRANIKSNEPGLIGETQPASIRLAGGPASQRSQITSSSSSSNTERNEDWTASSNSNGQSERADLALASPDFESSHKSERLRSPRHFH